MIGEVFKIYKKLPHNLRKHIGLSAEFLKQNMEQKQFPFLTPKVLDLAAGMIKECPCLEFLKSSIRKWKPLKTLCTYV